MNPFNFSYVEESYKAWFYLLGSETLNGGGKYIYYNGPHELWNIASRSQN